MGVNPHVIMLLDILGYKNMMSEADDENEYLEKVHTLMTLLSKYIEEYTHGIDEVTDCSLNLSRFKFLIFSDSILFFAPYNSENDRVNLTNNLIYSLCQFLFQYKKRGIFFRGGITSGQLFYDEKLHFVFGSGIIRAYELENNIAVYPRIVIDTSLNPSHVLIGHAQDEDGIWYIDYLNLGYNLLCNNHNKIDNIPYDTFISFLKDHRESIRLSLDKYKYNDRIYSKYGWLASYHNRFCNNRNHSYLTIDLKRYRNK